MTTQTESPTRKMWNTIDLDVQPQDIISCVPGSKSNCTWANAITRQREDIEKATKAFHQEEFGKFIGVDVQRAGDNTSGRAELVYENGSIHGTFQNDPYAGMLIMANDLMASEMKAKARRGRIAGCVTTWSTHARRRGIRPPKFGGDPLLNKSNELGGFRRYSKLGFAEREAKLHASPLYTSSSVEDRRAADQELRRSYHEGKRINNDGAQTPRRRRRSDAASVRKSGRYE